MTHRGFKSWKVLIVLGLVAGLLLAGCDNVLGGEDDPGDGDAGEDTGDVADPVVAEDGSLVASIAGVPTDLQTTTAGDDDLLFAAFVFNSGGDPLSAADSAENWVALVAEEIVDGSASGTAFQIVDGVRGDEWVGTAGESYDVYYTVYRVTLQDDGPPLKNGEHFTESNPECVCGTVDWQSPVTYEQDGNKTLASSYGEYLETSHVEFVAQGALGLIGFVMKDTRLNDAFGDSPEVGTTHIFEDADGNDIGISATVTQFDEVDETLGVIHAGLDLVIAGYEYPDMDPAPTATGAITLSIVATQDGVQEVGFATSTLELSQGELSVAIMMDGTASDFDAETGAATTFTGSFTCEGADHDLAILVEMYNIIP